MARSRRKTPKGPVTCSGWSRGNKDYRSLANRALRRRTKSLMSQGEFDNLPMLREVSDPWTWRGDGKARFDANAYPEWMRK